jgi:hypothetical protein
MEHEFETRVLGGEDIQRCNQEIGRLSIAAYQIMSRQDGSELAQRLRMQDFRETMIARSAVPQHVYGQYELVLPIENVK